MTAIQKYLDGVTGYHKQIGRAQPLVGESGRVADYVRAAGESSAIKDGVLTAVGAAAGVIVGYKHDHPVLGLISGISIGRNGPALLDAELRSEATWNLAQTHAGVFLSAAMPENKALGFGLGYIAAGIARYFYGGGL